MRSKALIVHAYDILDECRTLLCAKGFPAIADQLAGTAIRWIEHPTVGGLAWHSLKKIELNWVLFSDPANTANFRNTVIHEIAHIGAPGYGHTRKWKALDLLLGGTGERCHEMDVSKPRTKLQKAQALRKQLYAEIQKCDMEDAVKIKTHLDKLHDGPSVVDLNPHLYF